MHLLVFLRLYPPYGSNHFIQNGFIINQAITRDSLNINGVDDHLLSHEKPGKGHIFCKITVFFL